MYIKYSQALSSTEALARILKHIKRAVDNAKRGLFPLYVVPLPPPPRSRFDFSSPQSPYNANGISSNNDGEATETSLKNCFRAASKFIALIPSCLIRQTLAIFFLS